MTPPKFAYFANQIISNLILSENGETWTLRQPQSSSSMTFSFEEDNRITTDDTDPNMTSCQVVQFMSILMSMVSHYNRMGYGKLTNYGIIKSIVMITRSWEVSMELWKRLGFTLEWCDPKDTLVEGIIMVHPEVSTSDFQMVYDSVLFDRVMLVANMTPPMPEQISYHDHEL